jgi:hypothetical protein
MSNSGVYIGPVHEVFRIADRIAEQERMAERSKIVTRKARVVPMPTIDSNPNIEGPLVVTQEFINKCYQKNQEDKAKEMKGYERSLLECLGKKERLQYKLTCLSPKKKKENKKIVSINFQLRELDERIEKLQEESGINLSKVDSGSKLGRIWNRVKSTVVKLYKKAKKFVKKHADAIEGFLIVAVPVIGAAIFKKLLGL